MIETNYISKKSSLSTWPIAFLLIVILATAWVAFYNHTLDKENNKILSDIRNREANIKELNSDPRIQIYSLLEANSFAFKELEKRNKITEYIKHLEWISNIYWMEFDWFNFSDWKVTTSARVNSTDDWAIAYEKTVRFIRNYRSSESALFNLNFISSIDWWADSMRFNLDFDLK